NTTMPNAARLLNVKKSCGVAHRKRIGSAPGDPALGVDAFEVANQQRSEIDPGGQAGAAHGGSVEAGTLRFDEGVEAVLSQKLIQPTIEGMTRGRRQAVAVTYIA